MKNKIWLITGLASIFMLVLTTTAMAQGEVPPPYAGMTNPFQWNDTAAQAAGKESYKLCLGCHGPAGDNLAQANFSSPDFTADLEANPDYYFWVVTEGRLDKGMPTFKSSLTDEQRWQVLTYISSLSSTGSSSPTPTTPSDVPAVKGLLRLTAPDQAPAGQPVALRATFEDEQGKPLANTPITFYVSANLFTTGLAEIGQGVTDSQGVAILQYVPHLDGQMDIVAKYGSNEARATVNVAGGNQILYQTDVGIHFPSVGEPIIYPKSALDLGPDSSAPKTAFRLPGGIFSWMFILAGVVFMIWFTYFRVWFQVFRIPTAREVKGSNIRLVPTIGLIVVVCIGLLLITMLLTGPYSHLGVAPT